MICLIDEMKQQPSTSEVFWTDELRAFQVGLLVHKWVKVERDIKRRP